MYKPMMSGQIVQNIERDVDGRNWYHQWGSHGKEEGPDLGGSQLYMLHELPHCLQYQVCCVLHPRNLHPHYHQTSQNICRGPTHWTMSYRLTEQVKKIQEHLYVWTQVWTSWSGSSLLQSQT